MLSTGVFPAFAGLDCDTAFAWRDGELLSRGRLWSDARQLAESLPDRGGVFNLCEDRYLFTAVLLAALQRGQVCLLPPSGNAAALRQILEEFPDAYVASEQAPADPACPWFRVVPPEPGHDATPPASDPDRPALVVFTSGSEGRPKACRHSVRTFEVSARMALRSLGLDGARSMIVSTTPPQHMYGLETSVFWPLFSSLVQYSGRPFFPEDIRRTLRTAPLPCLLATTPTHLSALIRTGGEWPNLRGILSSTARLSDSLARQAEAATGAGVREIYGSTETLSFASRQTARETLWRPYGEARLTPAGNDGAWLTAAHLPSKAWLEDLFRIEPDGRFEVLGRAADLVKIGGKRGSLADLNRRLADLAGVEDGLFYTYEDARGELRTGAVVVSGLSKQAIVSGLRPFLDEVFLPKRIRYVRRIPRNSVGKILKDDLERLLAALEPLDR